MLLFYCYSIIVIVLLFCQKLSSSVSYKLVSYMRDSTVLSGVPAFSVLKSILFWLSLGPQLNLDLYPF